MWLFLLRKYLVFFLICGQLHDKCIANSIRLSVLYVCTVALMQTVHMFLYKCRCYSYLGSDDIIYIYMYTISYHISISIYFVDQLIDTQLCNMYYSNMYSILACMLYMSIVLSAYDCGSEWCNVYRIRLPDVRNNDAHQNLRSKVTMTSFTINLGCLKLKTLLCRSQMFRRTLWKRNTLPPANMPPPLKL